MSIYGKKPKISGDASNLLLSDFQGVTQPSFFIYLKTSIILLAS